MHFIGFHAEALACLAACTPLPLHGLFLPLVMGNKVASAVAPDPAACTLLQGGGFHYPLLLLRACPLS